MISSTFIYAVPESSSSADLLQEVQTLLEGIGRFDKIGGRSDIIPFFSIFPYAVPSTITIYAAAAPPIASKRIFFASAVNAFLNGRGT